MSVIISAAITGLLTLIGTVITCFAAARKTEASMLVRQAVTDTKIEELTREVREHNHFARRVPVAEEQIRALEHRMARVEQGQEGRPVA